MMGALQGAFLIVVHLQLAVREVENGALLSTQEDSVFDLTLAEPEIQERLSTSGGSGLV